MSNWQMSGMGGTVADWITFRKWNVTQSPSPTGANIALTSVAAVSPNDVWAVGSYFNTSLRTPQSIIEQWNGKKWVLVSSPVLNESGLSGVAAVSANDIWTVGEYNPSGNAWETLIEQWNGSAWSVVQSPNGLAANNYLSAISIISASDIWAVGYSSFSPSPGVQTLTEHWDGTSWSIVSSPNLYLETGYNYLYSVTAIASNDMWAVGDAYSGSCGGQQTLTMHWDGSQWTIVASPSQGGTTANNFLYGVAAAASNDVWAVGYYSSGSGAQLPIIMHWDGNSWSVISNPNQGPYDNFLYAVTEPSPNDVWAVGNYYTGATSGVLYNTLVLHWHGRQWNIIPSSGRANMQTSILYGLVLTSSQEAWQ